MVGCAAQWLVIVNDFAFQPGNRRMGNPVNKTHPLYSVDQYLFDAVITLNVVTKSTFIAHKTTYLEFVIFSVDIDTHARVASKFQGIVMKWLNVSLLISMLPMALICVVEDLT